jgi:hypothetical protein
MCAPSKDTSLKMMKRRFVAQYAHQHQCGITLNYDTFRSIPARIFTLMNIQKFFNFGDNQGS